MLISAVRRLRFTRAVAVAGTVTGLAAGTVLFQTADCKADSSESASIYTASQQDLLHSTISNPTPTMTPPPIAPLTGALGQRHVISVIGLPFSGQSFVAKWLGRYLSFFHGADVKLFNLKDYVGGSHDDNAENLMQTIICFMDEQTAPASGNYKELLDQGTIDFAASADVRLKNADTGKIAIIYDTEASDHVDEKWSGSTKGRRRWIVDRIKTYSPSVCTMFIEMIVGA